MTEKVSKSTLLKTESELLVSKRLGKKIFLYSIAVFFGSIFLKIAFSGVLKLIAYSGIHLAINSADNIFSNLLILVSTISLIAIFAGILLWTGVSRDYNFRQRAYRHMVSGIKNSNHPANPLSYHYRNSR